MEQTNVTLDTAEMSVLTDMVISPEFTKEDILKFIKDDVIRVGQNNSNMTSRAVYSMKVLHGLSDEEIFGAVLEIESDAVSQISTLSEDEKAIENLRKELLG